MLDSIVAEARVRAQRLAGEQDRLRAAAARAEPARSLWDALASPGLSVIAEVKRRSPSAGDIAPDLDPAALATAYEEGAAAAVSVLTEPAHFGGSPEDLAAVRAAVGLPTLRKDFVVDPVQVWETRAMGADAVLVIVAAVGPDLDELVEVSLKAGVEPLVEVHTEEECAAAVASGARIIGVNNRDLGTFDVDMSVAERLRPALPEDVITVAESGVRSPADAQRMARAGYDAILVGRSAATAAQPAAFVAGLRSTA